MDNVMDALNFLSPASLDYTEWVKVGMALHAEGYHVNVWDDWSKQDSLRWRKGDCQKRWAGFSANDGVKGGTIIQMAKERGWIWKNPMILDWNDEIFDDGDDYNQYSAPDKETWNGFDDLITFLNTIYRPSDIVGYVTSDVYEIPTEDGTVYKPSKGVYTKSAGQLIRELEKYKKSGDMGFAIGDYKPEAGAWIRFNPLDGEGVKDSNVIDFRYALVECDDMPIGDQEAKYRELNLPIATLVHSGNKSLHALVHIDAEDKDEYKKRVSFLYSYLEEHGVKLDTQNRNPARLSRMPGVLRNGKRQYLLGTNIGTKSWDDWTEFINCDVPEGQPLTVYSIGEYKEKPMLEPAEELVEGIFRCGQKALFTGGSKTSKTFMLIELGLAIATGTEWLGHKTKQGKVLYLNMEIQQADFDRRVYDICNQLEMPLPDDFIIWDGRGKVKDNNGKTHPLDILVPNILATLAKDDYIAVILDPIYKVMQGDESSSEAVSKLCSALDRIAATGTAIIYCHHHTKGTQGQKSAIDRGSGSGVFGRDADAIMDMTVLDIPEEDMLQIADDMSAIPMRMEFVLRGFPNISPIDMWFKYPTHVISDGLLTKYGAKGSSQSKGQALGNTGKRAKEITQEKFETAFVATGFGSGMVKLELVAQYLDVDPQSIRKRIRDGKIEGFKILNGYLMDSKTANEYE